MPFNASQNLSNFSTVISRQAINILIEQQQTPCGYTTGC